MTASHSSTHSAHLDLLRAIQGIKRTRGPLAVGVALAALFLATILALAPQAYTSEAEQLAVYVDKHAQSFTASEKIEPTIVTRDNYSATPGVATLATGGTNHDWAKLVLLYGGFPMSENNVTVMTRWMRQENGPPDWFNRNNPLNNGWGSGGGSGLGSYSNLEIAAQNAAEALHGNPGYGAIVLAFNQSAPTDVTERAIWASPWASSHYANGGHWAYTPVPVVKAPAGAW